MKTWLFNKWDSLRTNFWFVPTVMVAGALILSFLTLAIDHLTGSSAWDFSAFTYTRGPEGSRALLSIVAGSMINIASLTFSITIVTLQLTSSQFGPRLLRNFMRDRGNQLVLGTFIATFTYCLLIIRTVNGTQNHEFVPRFSVLMALLMSIAALGVLIYFINHTAHSIQAETVIASVGSELEGALDRLFPRPDRPDFNGPPEHLEPPDAQLLHHIETDGVPIPATRNNYFQAVDIDRLVAIAVAHDLVLRLSERPGAFLVRGQEIVRAWPPHHVDDSVSGEIQSAFFVGARRNLTQDASFAIDQLVEIAVRALSPGINDPFTAIACIDRLTAAFCDLAGRQPPSAQHFDENDRLRLIADPETKTDLLDTAFHPLRQAARGSESVVLQLLDDLALIARSNDETDFLAAVLHHAKLIHDETRANFPSPHDRSKADIRYTAIRDALQPHAGNTHAAKHEP